MVDQERIRQMPRLFEHGHHMSFRSRIIEFDRGNNALSDTMIEFFKECEGSSLPCHRKRIGIETVRRAGNGLPLGAGKIPGVPDASVVRVAPADAPMRRIAAETVDSLHDSVRQPAKDIGNRRSGMPGIEAADL